MPSSKKIITAIVLTVKKPGPLQIEIRVFAIASDNNRILVCIRVSEPLISRHQSHPKICKGCHTAQVDTTCPRGKIPIQRRVLRHRNGSGISLRAYVASLDKVTTFKYTSGACVGPILIRQYSRSVIRKTPFECILRDDATF